MFISSVLHVFKIEGNVSRVIYCIVLIFVMSVLLCLL